MYKEGILNLPPILYILVPISLGLLIGFLYKKYTSYKEIYLILISILISLIYIEIIEINTSSQGYTELKVILFIWISIIIYISIKVYSYFQKKINNISK